MERNQKSDNKRRFKNPPNKVHIRNSWSSIFAKNSRDNNMEMLKNEHNRFVRIVKILAKKVQETRTLRN